MIYTQKMTLLGTLSVIYTQKNDIIKDPFCGLHTQRRILLETLSVIYMLKTILLGAFSGIYTQMKSDIIKDPFCVLHNKK